MHVKSSKPVSISEANEILLKRKDDTELGYEQTQAMEHASKFAKVKYEDVKKLIDALTKNSKIDRETAIKIIDVHPTTPATLRAILVKNKIDVSEEEVTAILKEVA